MGGEFVPIFYKSNKLDLLESGSFWLSETPTIPGNLNKNNNNNINANEIHVY